MRIFLPATPEMLRSLAADKSIKAPGGWAYAVTADLERDLSDLDEDGISQYAFDEAALASLRMLATIDPEYVDADHPAGVVMWLIGTSAPARIWGLQSSNWQMRALTPRTLRPFTLTIRPR